MYIRKNIFIRNTRSCPKSNKKMYFQGSYLEGDNIDL